MLASPYAAFRLKAEATKSVTVVASGFSRKAAGCRRKARIELRNFVQPSDLLAIDVDAKASNLTALSVETYLEKREDAVILAVGFATLADATSYVARTTLEAAAKNITVVVENTGHRPLAR